MLSPAPKVFSIPGVTPADVKLFKGSTKIYLYTTAALNATPAMAGGDVAPRNSRATDCTSETSRNTGSLGSYGSDRNIPVTVNTAPPPAADTQAETSANTNSTIPVNSTSTVRAVQEDSSIIVSNTNTVFQLACATLVPVYEPSPTDVQLKHAADM
jgi:hypothetical protein